jgi:hypothetical protein
MTFDAQLRTALESIYAKPTPAEALAIVDVARLAAAADKKTDLSEQVVLLALTKIVCEMAGMTALPDAPKAIDPKRLHDIGEQLVPQGARELAYASAFLIMVQDLEVTKEESQMAGALGDALLLDAARAKQLASQMETLVRSARR